MYVTLYTESPITLLLLPDVMKLLHLLNFWMQFNMIKFRINLCIGHRNARRWQSSQNCYISRAEINFPTNE